MLKNTTLALTANQSIAPSVVGSLFKRDSITAKSQSHHKCRSRLYRSRRAVTGRLRPTPPTLRRPQRPTVTISPENWIAQLNLPVSSIALRARAEPQLLTRLPVRPPFPALVRPIQTASCWWFRTVIPCCHAATSNSFHRRTDAFLQSCPIWFQRECCLELLGGLFGLSCCGIAHAKMIVNGSKIGQAFAAAPSKVDIEFL